MRFAYPIDVRPMTDEEGGGFLVEFPDWNGAVTDGRDMNEALANARDCLEELIAYRIRHREPIPEPGAAGNRIVVEPEAGLALQGALWLAMQDRGVSADDLAGLLGEGCTTAQADRLLNPRLKAKPEMIHKGLAALGKRVVVELEDAAIPAAA